MNDQELLRLFELAKATIDDGGSMLEVNAIIREQTDNKFAGIMVLGMYLGPEALEGTPDKQIGEMVKAESDVGPVDKSSKQIFAELREDPENQGLRKRFKDKLAQEREDEFGTRDVLESALQGISFGVADDILGDEFKERLAIRREEHPWASLAAESVGLLVPGTAVLKGAQWAAKGARGIQAARAAKAAEAGVRGTTRASRAAQTAREAKAARTALAASGAAKSPRGILRGAGALAVGTGLESGALAAGEAEAGRPEGSVGLSDRAGDFAKGFAFGAPFGGVFGVAGPTLRGVGRLLRTDDQLAKLVAKEAVAQTGQSADDLYKALRHRQSLLGGEMSTLADASEELGVHARRFAAAGTGHVRRPGGPLEAVRLRVLPEVVEKAKRSIYAPFESVVYDDPYLIKLMTVPRRDADGIIQNTQIMDAAREVVKGPLDRVKTITFKQMQSIRNRLNAQFNKATAGGFIEDAGDVKQVQFHFDEVVENLTPGYASANNEFIQFSTRMTGQEELIRAIDKALPTIVPEVPSFGGIFASTYKTVGRPAARRRVIMEMVAEALLADGEAGIARLQLLLKQGKIAQLFSGINQARHVGQKALRAQPGGLINPESPRLP